MYVELNAVLRCTPPVTLFSTKKTTVPAAAAHAISVPSEVNTVLALPLVSSAEFAEALPMMILPLAISANSATATPLSFIVTAPDDTAKLSELNEATPLLEVDASSPAIVKVSVADTAASIPYPEVMVKVFPSAIVCVVEPSEITQLSIAPVPSTPL